jgi:hypothetical protein
MNANKRKLSEFLNRKAGNPDLLREKAGMRGEKIEAWRRALNGAAVIFYH